MRRVILATLLVASTSPVLAADWRLAWIIKSSDQMGLIFVDAGTVKRNGQIVRYWKDEWFDPPLPSSVAPFNRMRALVEADCEQRKFRMFGAVGYSDEKPVTKLGDVQWEYASPDSVSDNEIRKVCSGGWTQKAFKPDAVVANSIISDLRATTAQ